MSKGEDESDEERIAVIGEELDVSEDSFILTSPTRERDFYV